MMSEDYRRAFTKAQQDLAQAVAERDERNAKIVQLKQTIRVLGELLEEDPDQIEALIGMDEGGRPSGITSAARTALQTAKANNYPEALTVADVKELMSARGFDFTGQANALASLTTILRRMRLNDEVEELTRSDGKRAYRWIGVVASPGGTGIIDPNVIKRTLEIQSRKKK